MSTQGLTMKELTRLFKMYFKKYNAFGDKRRKGEKK